CARRFGEAEIASFLDLGDWIAHVAKVASLLPVAPQPTGRLSAALDQVSRDRCPTKSIPVIPRPAELVYGRGQRQGRVFDPAGDAAGRALSQGLDDGASTKISVGTDQPWTDRGER